MTARAEQLLNLHAKQNKEFSSSDLSKAVEKLIRKPRGGYVVYCFEQNTLFAAVLRSLGYNVYTAAARYSTYTLSEIHCLLPQAHKECYKNACYVCNEMLIVIPQLEQSV